LSDEEVSVDEEITFLLSDAVFFSIYEAGLIFEVIDVSLEDLLVKLVVRPDAVLFDEEEKDEGDD
jgi:hypothetical protein